MIYFKTKHFFFLQSYTMGTVKSNFFVSLVPLYLLKCTQVKSTRFYANN